MDIFENYVFVRA